MNPCKWNFRRLAAALLLAAALVLAAGCGQQAAAPATSSDRASSSASSASSSASSSSSSAASSASKSAQPESLTIKVYYPNADGTKLVASSRKVTADSKTEKGQTNIFPKKVQLQSVKVEKGVATVSFSKELQKNFVGGSTGEEMLVGSIVNTLTEFPEVKKVRILIDGKGVESLAGHMDLTEPLTRMKNLL